MKKLILTIALSLSFSFACDPVITIENYGLGCKSDKLQSFTQEAIKGGTLYRSRDITLSTDQFGTIDNIVQTYGRISYTEFMLMAEKLERQYGVPYIEGDLYGFYAPRYTVVLTRTKGEVIVFYALK